MADVLAVAGLALIAVSFLCSNLFVRSGMHADERMRAAGHEGLAPLRGAPAAWAGLSLLSAAGGVACLLVVVVRAWS